MPSSRRTRADDSLAPAVILTGNLGPPRRPKSSGEIALALTRSLGRHGVPVYRFHPERSQIDLESRYCTHVPCPNLYDDPPGLVAALLDFARACKVRPVLFPAADGAVEFVARHEAALGDAFALACASWDCVQRIQNKQRLLEHAAALGVPIPDTSFPRGADELDRFASTLRFPAVVKPLTSHHWKRPEVAAVVRGAKAIVVKEGGELRDVYRAVAPLAPDMMVQEIVPGEIDRLLTFIGYVGRGGRPLAGCVRKKLRQYPAGFGYCCLAETVRDPEIMDLSIRLLTSLGYLGIAGVEFKRDPRTGQAKLIEINARAVRTTSTAIGAGVDLPWIAYQDLTGVRLSPVFDYRVPVRWIHLRSELRAVAPLIRRGELSLREWSRIFRGPTAQVIWAWDDVKPGILNVALPALHRLSRRRGVGAGQAAAGGGE